MSVRQEIEESVNKHSLQPPLSGPSLEAPIPHRVNRSPTFYLLVLVKVGCLLILLHTQLRQSRAEGHGLMP